jgi:hypothetical protein
VAFTAAVVLIKKSSGGPLSSLVIIIRQSIFQSQCERAMMALPHSSPPPHLFGLGRKLNLYFMHAGGTQRFASIIGRRRIFSKVDPEMLLTVQQSHFLVKVLKLFKLIINFFPTFGKHILILFMCN